MEVFLLIVLLQSNHAGTTPNTNKIDPNRVFSEVLNFLNKKIKYNSSQLATIGKVEYYPNQTNVIPKQIVFTIDLRNRNDLKLKKFKKELVNKIIFYSKKYSITSKIYDYV